VDFREVGAGIQINWARRMMRENETILFKKKKRYRSEVD